MRHGCITASLISLTSFLRELPLFFAARPKTALRVLCLIAFDTLHAIHFSKRLSQRQIIVLAKFLDFAACMNAAADHKQVRWKECQSLRAEFDQAGLDAVVDVYLEQLHEFETGRPLTGGDRECFEKCRVYRETVARLSLEMIATIALRDASVESESEAALWKNDLEILFRIVMQCQIIDDVLDYKDDTTAGLPSFLTASASLSRAFAWTADAARNYAKFFDESRSASSFPFRLALAAVSAFTGFVIRVSQRWRMYYLPRPLDTEPKCTAWLPHRK